LNTLINADNITFEYDTDDGAQEVLKDFSVSFETGAFTAVLGHNGSGKSTLAKLLNGLLTPSKGKVTVNGMDTADEERSIDIKRTVGMVFQNPDNQLVATVVDEDVAFGLENLGIPHDEMVKRVDEALAAVGMSEFKKSAPRNLSGGQKQRVAIAGIIAIITLSMIRATLSFT
jgi:energy-coupling factor transport system ATP-binding protein